MCRMIFHNFDLSVSQKDNSTQYKPLNCAIFPLFMPLSHCHSMHFWVEYGDLTEYNMSIMMHLNKKIWIVEMRMKLIWTHKGKNKSLQKQSFSPVASSTSLPASFTSSSLCFDRRDGISYPSACYYNHIVTPPPSSPPSPTNSLSLSCANTHTHTRTQPHSTSEPWAVATLTTTPQHSLK